MSRQKYARPIARWMTLKGLWFLTLLLLISSAAAAAPLAQPAPTAALAPFQVPYLLSPGSGHYRRENLTLIRNHAAKTWILSQKFSQNLSLGPSARPLISQLELIQSSGSQKPRYSCPRQQTQASFKHPQLGPLLICRQVLGQHQGRPLIGARISPLQGNPQLQLSYTGTDPHLRQVLAQLKKAPRWQFKAQNRNGQTEFGQWQLPGYPLLSSRLVWTGSQSSPSLDLRYVKMAHFPERGIRAHFIQQIHQHPQSQIVGADFRCPAKAQKQTYRHPQWGEYLLCVRDETLKAHPKARNQTPLAIRKAWVYPRTGNQLPHIRLTLQNTRADLLPVLNSLRKQK